jgi:hypothetical protein
VMTNENKLLGSLAKLPDFFMKNEGL